MKDEADGIISRMPELFCELLNRDQLKPWCPSRGRWVLDDIPNKGVYIYYEKDKALYVGRSDNVAERVKSHCKRSSGSATFAFILARDMWGIWKGPCWDRPLPKKNTTLDIEWPIKKGTRTKRLRINRGNLLADVEIFEDFKAQIERVKNMKLRVLEIENEYEQAIFEVYAARALNTRYNDFKNH